MKRRRKAKRSGTKRSPPGRLNPVPPSRAPVVSVVIPLANERRTIASVIREARKVHPQTEVIVVSNGTRDGSDRIAQKLGAVVLRYDQPLGHDVGRAIGALHARGEVLLFTDGDIVIAAKDLLPFVKAVQYGVDIALNDYSGPTDKQDVHNVVLAKHALNHIQHRPDLKGVSMTAIPHAISRRTVAGVGAAALAIPPLAQTMAILQGLRVHAVHAVPVGRRNPRKRPVKSDPLEGLIVGDHLEAIDWLLRSKDSRGSFPDLGRNRDFAG